MRVSQGSWAWKDWVDLAGHQGFEGDTVTQANEVDKNLNPFKGLDTSASQLDFLSTNRGYGW